MNNFIIIIYCFFLLASKPIPKIEVKENSNLERGIRVEVCLGSGVEVVSQGVTLLRQKIKSHLYIVTLVDGKMIFDKEVAGYANITDCSKDKVFYYSNQHSRHFQERIESIVEQVKEQYGGDE